jgi:LIVCS family branched-chain amino acid:cation transporter
LFTEPELQNTNQISGNLFLHGLREGYNTMDLLAAFFFSSIILNILRLRLGEERKDAKSYLKTAFHASIVGVILLASIYIGFSYLAAIHGSDLATISKDALLANIAMRIVGPHAGPLVCLTIGLACLTTAIALISAFTDFVQKEIFEGKIAYEIVLIGALGLTFFVSTFEFTGISAFLGPILEICYPGLILLTFLNIAYRIKNFRPIKTPVFLTFAVSAFLYFWS